jgi:hypothetical protein
MLGSLDGRGVPGNGGYCDAVQQVRFWVTA